MNVKNTLKLTLSRILGRPAKQGTKYVEWAKKFAIKTRTKNDSRTSSRSTRPCFTIAKGL
jgi:hypothetical protein